MPDPTDPRAVADGPSAESQDALTYVDVDVSWGNGETYPVRVASLSADQARRMFGWDPTDPRAEDQDALTHLDLLDPVVVHLNMLRGRIAKLTDAQIRHLHPQLFAGTDPRAEAAQPTLGYDPDCPDCKGTGQRDSGGTHPWGEPAMMMCDCDAPPHPVADDPSGIVQQMTEVGPRGPVPDDVLHHGAWQMADDLEGWFPSHNMARYADMMRDLAFDLRNARATEADLRAEVERLRTEKAAIGQAVQVMFETSKAETDRLTRHLEAIANRSEEVSKAGGATNYARAALSPETDGGQDG